MMGFWDAVASAGSYANNLHLAADRYPRQHLVIDFGITAVTCENVLCITCTI